MNGIAVLTLNCARCGLAFSWARTDTGGAPRKYCESCRIPAARETMRAHYHRPPRPTIHPAIALACASCGITFQWMRISAGTQPKFCGTACRDSAYRKRANAKYQPHPYAPAPRVCQRCRKSFVPKKAIQCFCSLLCQSPARYQRRAFTNCRRCGQQISGRVTKQYCSRLCRLRDQSSSGSQRARNGLKDGYITDQISRNLNRQIRPSQIPISMIESYRSVLLVKREIKRRLNQ